MIAPDHGIIWRKNPEKILEAYSRWCVNEGNGKALIIYDSMWHSTEMMAKSIAAGLLDKGISYKLLNLQVNHRSNVMCDVLEASAIILGCPTLNNGMLPRMAGFLMYMRGLRPTNKIGAAFGSFGSFGFFLNCKGQSIYPNFTKNRRKMSNTRNSIKTQYHLM